jgi:thiol-disulfide isomerase/thioredoxin
MRRFFLAFLLVATVSNAKTAPSFRGELLKGGKTSLDASLKPDRLLLVSFWATWCVPCMEEIEHVKKALEKDPTIPLDVLTINVNREERSEVSSTASQMGIPFPILLDPQSEIFGKYQKASTLPYSVLIGPDRNIEAEFNGYHPTMFEKIHQAALKLKKPASKPGT